MKINIKKFLFSYTKIKNYFSYFVRNSKELKNFLVVFEKYLYLNFIFFNTFKTRRKYLWEKFRSNKEKVSWLKTWAWKHEGKVSSYKGFHIPITIPKTEQSKFFLKKREEDEQKLWDKFVKDDKIFPKFKKDTVITRRRSSTQYLLQISKLKKASVVNQNWLYPVSHLELPRPFLKKRRKKKNKLLGVVKPNQKLFSTTFKKYKSFKLKFVKNFLKKIYFGIKPVKRQYLWTFFNLGFSTTDFLNFFYVNAFPTFLLDFKFFKVKLLLLKKFKSIFQRKSKSMQKFIRYKTIYFNMNKFMIKQTKKSFTQPSLTRLFFFLKIYKNWTIAFYNNLQKKISFISFLMKNHSKTLSGKLFFYFFAILSDFFIRAPTKKFLLNKLVIARLQGFLDFIFLFSKGKWKKRFLSKFLLKTSVLNNLSLLRFSTQVTKNFFYFYPLGNKSNFLIFLENFYMNFKVFLEPISFFQKNNSMLYLEWFTALGLSTENDFLFWSKKLTKTFFQFFKNWIKTHEQVRFFFYTSFSHQVHVLEDFNVADTLFKFMIRRGKWLTARRVFLKFLKKFKKKYGLPPLMIFTHAMLMVEPKVWIKEKKIAGKQYDIPIYISADRSKRIAIRWLLQSAKKRKRASITESLAQEVWDACFKMGGAFSNKENLHMVIRRNKAYMRWL